MRFHHIGFATPDVCATLSEMRQLCPLNEQSGFVIDAKQDNAVLKMCTLDEKTWIEFVDGRISHSFAGQNAMYHMCFESDDFEKDIVRIKGLGWIAITHINEAALFGNKRVQFFKKPNMPMIEVKES